MSTGRVLVVDEELQIRRVLRTTLSSQGYEVSDVRTGEEDLLAIRDRRFGLVLLDTNMPGIGGLAACREIRAGSDVAIIILTVRNSEAEKVTALDAGADDYITKPFWASRTVGSHSGGAAAGPGAARDRIHLGEVEMDLLARRVRRKGRETRLTPKEFEPLQYLVANPGRPLPQSKLLQAVWGPDYGDQVEYLARPPEICLVGESPHTNVPGSPRAKRWEDVLVLLEAGVNVITTMNIQHLESLNDQVRDISGIQVCETVAD